MSTNFNNAVPAAPPGYTNVTWQTDGNGNDSACVPTSILTSANTLITSLVPGDVLVWNGTDWVNAMPPSGVLLENNGTANTVQNLLNLISGSGITLTDNGVGGITIAATGGGGGNKITTGTNASFKSSPPGSPSAGDMFVCTDSPYSYIYNGATWDSYVFGFKVVEPLTANVTQINAGSSGVTVDSTHGGLGIIFPSGGSGQYFGIAAAVPGSGAYYVDVAFTTFLPGTNGGMGVGLSNGALTSSASTYMKLGYEPGVNQGTSNIGFMMERQQLNSYSSFNANSTAQAESFLFGPLIWMRVFDDRTTNRTWYISTDGEQWAQIFQEARTTFLTPSEGVFIIGNASSTVQYQTKLLHFSIHT